MIGRKIMKCGGGSGPAFDHILGDGTTVVIDGGIPTFSRANSRMLNMTELAYESVAGSLMGSAVLIDGKALVVRGLPSSPHPKFLIETWGDVGGPETHAELHGTDTLTDIVRAVGLTGLGAFLRNTGEVVIADTTDHGAFPFTASNPCLATCGSLGFVGTVTGGGLWLGAIIRPDGTASYIPVPSIVGAFQAVTAAAGTPGGTFVVAFDAMESTTRHSYVAEVTGSGVASVREVGRLVPGIGGPNFFLSFGYLSASSVTVRSLSEVYLIAQNIASSTFLIRYDHLTGGVSEIAAVGGFMYPQQVCTLGKTHLAGIAYNGSGYELIWSANGIDWFSTGLPVLLQPLTAAAVRKT